MKYLNSNQFISVFVVVLSLWSALAPAGEHNYNLSHFLKEADPVRLPPSETLRADGETIADNIHNARWDAPLLRSPRGFEALRYARENGLVNNNEFLDAQDYLQIQADFAAPETRAFQILEDEGRLPVRVPAVSVKRVYYSHVTAHKQPGILKSKGAIAGGRFGWLTEVIVDPEFYRQFSAVDVSSCDGELRGDGFKCLAQLYADDRHELLYWHKLLVRNLPGLSYRGYNHDLHPQLLLGSIPPYLTHIKNTQWYSVDFFPLYGALGWGDLTAMRAADANPGTIYHPDVSNNFFYPHGLYGGASAFVRHDLIHHQFVSGYSTEDRRFLAWMHDQESLILDKMDQAMESFDEDAREAKYNNTGIPVASRLASACYTSRENIRSAYYNGEPQFPSAHFWSEPGSHRTLFPGVFADMLGGVAYNTYFTTLMSMFDQRWKTGYNDWGKHFYNILEMQCNDAGYFYTSSFEIYHGYLEKLLTENRDYIYSEFGISVDELFSRIR